MDGALLGMAFSHALFVASGVVYSVYWVLQDRGPSAAAAALFFAAVLAGFAGALGMFASALAAAPQARFGRLRPRHVLAGCAALLAVVYAGTTPLRGRPFTSELPFAVIWGAAELTAILIAWRRRWLSTAASALAAALAGLALAVCLVCYAIYFDLDGRARFFSGLVPYGAVALAMAVIGGMLALSARRPGARVADDLPD